MFLSGMLALATAAAADDSAKSPARAERISQEIDGVRFDYSADQADLVEALAPRVSALNQEAIAQSSAVWVMPEVDGPLSERDFRINRDAWLAAAAKALGLDAPTPLQIECYDRYLQLIGEFKAQTEAWVANARTNRQIKTVTLWNKAELRQRLLAGEKVPGFSTTKEEDLVHFDWAVRGAPAWPDEELAQRQKQIDALRLNYPFAAGSGPAGTVFSGRTAPRMAGAPQERLVAPEPAAGPVSFPFIIKPEHAGLSPREVVEAIFDKSVRAMRDSFAATTAPAPDQKSIARLILLNLVEVGLRERLIAKPEQNWFCEGTVRYLAWQVAQSRVGAEAARPAFGTDEALLEVTDLRSAVDLANWSITAKAPDPSKDTGRLAEAHGAFAAHAVRSMVQRHGDDFLAKLFTEIRKTPATKADMRAVAQAYKKLTGATVDVLLRDAVSVDSVAKLKPSWVAPGNEFNGPFTPVPAAAVAKPFPHEHSDLAPDARITWGRLENGLRYAIMPQAVPTRRASLYLLVEAGTYHEHDQERSYAHYVEHMAFNGLRDFPKQTLISRLSELGVAFGPHVNATTNLFTTTYNFNDLPVDDPEAMRTGVRILRNIADGMLFEPMEVKQESSVILQEGLFRAGGGGNWSEDLGHLPPLARWLPYDVTTSLFDETRILWWSRGAPIRTTKNATSQSLRAFYDRWYRPERMIVVVAGDVTPAEIEPMLREAFAGLSGRGPAESPPVIPDPRLKPGVEPAIHVVEFPQDTQLAVTLANTIPRTEGDSIERRRQLITLQAALGMIEARFAHSANFPCSYDAWTAPDVPQWDIPLLRITTTTPFLQAATLAVDREFRRAWLDGFNPRELERYVAKQRDTAANDSFEASRLAAAVFAQSLAFATANGVVFMSPENERALRERLLAELTPERCREALRAAWPWHRLNVVVTGPIKQKAVNKTALTKELLNARSVRLEPLDERAELAAFPYTSFGPAGTVASRRYDEALDTWFVTFANGVRLNVKRTKNERDWVRVHLNFGYGTLGTPKGNPGLRNAILLLWRDGLEGHPEYAGNEQPDGYHFDVRYSYYGDHFSLAQNSRAEALPRVLNYFAATLTHPGDRGNIETEVRRFIEGIVSPQHRTARGVAEGRIFEQASGGNLAMRNLTLAENLSPTCNEMRAWLKPQLANSPLEIAVVGDCEIDAVIAAVASTMGALPARETKDSLAQARMAEMRTGFRERVEFQGFTTVSAVSFLWPMADKPGAEDEARLTALARVLEARVWKRLREEMGDIYSPNVRSMIDGITGPRRLALLCTVESKPRAANRCASAIRQIAATLAAGGITDDEFLRALQPLKLDAETTLRSNTWWLERLGEAQSKPSGFADDVAIGAAYAKVTRAEVEALAKSLLRAENTAEVIAAPR